MLYLQHRVLALIGRKQCQLEGQDYFSKSSNCTFEIKFFWGTKSIPTHGKKDKT